MDIEAQMTMFAYYYIGIGLGVLILSYFQVRVSSMDSASIQVQHNDEVQVNNRVMKPNEY